MNFLAKYKIIFVTIISMFTSINANAWVACMALCDTDCVGANFSSGSITLSTDGQGVWTTYTNTAASSIADLSEQVSTGVESIKAALVTLEATLATAINGDGISIGIEGRTVAALNGAATGKSANMTSTQKIMEDVNNSRLNSIKENFGSLIKMQLIVKDRYTTAGARSMLTTDDLTENTYTGIDSFNNTTFTRAKEATLLANDVTSNNSSLSQQKLYVEEKTSTLVDLISGYKDDDITMQDMTSSLVLMGNKNNTSFALDYLTILQSPFYFESTYSDLDTADVYSLVNDPIELEVKMLFRLALGSSIDNITEFQNNQSILDRHIFK